MSSEASQFPLALLVVIGVVALIVIIVFAIALLSFLKAGKSDAASRRRRLNANAKDPLDPKF